MSVENLPTYPDLFSDTIKEQIPTIEEKLRKAGHLGDEGLLERISKDMEILKNAGLSKEDTYKNHRNMYMIFNACEENMDNNKINEVLEKTQNMERHDELIKNMAKNFIGAWCCWDRKIRMININNQQIMAWRIIWGGAEECPIEKHFNSNYHGYSRGDRDWFVYNIDKHEGLWIPDLLPAQVGMWGFCQSPSSVYRLDLEKYLKIFNIIKPVDLLPTKTKYYWCISTWGGEFSEDKIYPINDFSDRKNYIAIFGNKKCADNYLYLYVTDEKWLNENMEKEIEINGKKIKITEKNRNNHCLYRELEDGYYLSITTETKEISNYIPTKYKTHEFYITSNGIKLYDPELHLYFTNEEFLNEAKKNKKIIIDDAIIDISENMDCNRYISYTKQRYTTLVGY